MPSRIRAIAQIFVRFENLTMQNQITTDTCMIIIENYVFLRIDWY
jgi:hypothetical protein